MSPQLEQALAAMRGRRVLLVGDCMLDVYLYGETVRVSREAPVVIVRKEGSEHRLGGAANTAANLAALGLQVEVFATLGEDEAGATVRRLLEAAGVDCGRIQTIATGTATKTRVLAGAPGTTRQQVIRIDDEPREWPALDDDAVMARRIEAAAAGADLVAVSEYGLGAVGPATMALLPRLAQRKPVCVDSRDRLHELVGATVVTPNLPEAEQLLGRRLDSPAAVEQAGPAILERLGCEACLLTQGRGGMTLFLRDQPPSHTGIVGSEEVTDVTGAGDTALAAFAAGLAAKLGYQNAMRLANCAAGVVVTKLGTATATPAEIATAALTGEVELEPWAR